MALIWEKQVSLDNDTAYGELQYEADPANANYLRIYAVRYANSHPTQKAAVRVIDVTDPANPVEVFYAEILPNTQETTFTFPKNRRPLFDNLNFQMWWL